MFTDRKANSLACSRERLPWPVGKPFKILCLDGGGIRGIYASHLLAKCEHAFGPVGTKFDLIAGTSTGGIIAIGIGLGLSAQAIDDLYLHRGQEIFPDDILRRGVLRKIRWCFMPLHDHKALERILLSTFGDRKFGASENRLVIPAFRGPDPQIAVLKTDHHPDYKEDWQSEAWKIARSTSAAPTFFKGHEEKGAFFLDGGVWANNPIICAIAEALGAYDINPHQIRILSIGTGSTGERINERAIRAGAIGWRGIIKTAMYLTSDSALSQAQFIVGFENVIRFDPSLPDDKIIDLDDWKAASSILPPLAADDFKMRMVDLVQFFDDLVAPRERFYSG
jgi:uncharacterized protein